MLIAIVPIGVMLAGSVWVDSRFSLKHYTPLLSDTRLFSLLMRSIRVALGSTIISLIIAVPAAFLLARVNFRWRKLYKWCCFAPLLIPPHIHAIAWIYLLGKNGGLNRTLMSILGLQQPSIDLYNPLSAAVILALAYFPFIVLLALNALTTFDQRLEDAARLSNRPLRVFQSITLPIVAPQIVAGAIFVFLFSLFNYGVPALLRVNTYPVEIFAQFSAYYNEAKAVALTLPFFVLAMALLTFQQRFFHKREFITIGTDSTPRRQHHGNLAVIAFLFMTTVTLLTFFLPIGALITQSRVFSSFYTALRTSANEVVTTVGISMAAATMVTLLGYLLGQYLVFGRSEYRKKWLDRLTFVPFAFPAAIYGIGLIRTWNTSVTQVVYCTGLILMIAYAARFIPYAVRTVVAFARQVNPNLIEAAQFTAKRPWQRFISIELPLFKQGFAASWIIIFVLCMGELGATLLVIPPGMGTVSLKIYTLMHYGANQIVAALSLMLVGVNLTVLLLFTCFFKTNPDFSKVTMK